MSLEDRDWFQRVRRRKQDPLTVGVTLNTRLERRRRLARGRVRAARIVAVIVGLVIVVGFVFIAREAYGVDQLLS